jgi:SAM-dependent methyltransferase
MDAPVEPWVPTLVALASARAVLEDDAVDVLGADAVTALLRCDALTAFDGEMCLTARVFPMRSVYTLLPARHAGQDAVYFGEDSLVLFEIVWAARGHGHRAADLATGNGFLAAALATRYDHVVAADLSPRCVATAALVPIVNPHLRSRLSAVQMDVALGLRAGSFDLVTANPPWVPETTGPDGGPSRRFAAGGPTGFELPRRFIDAAAELLAPGGRAFVACIDIAFDDGRRPLRDHLPLLPDDLDVTITDTRRNQAFDYGPWARAKAPGATSAKHVVVELRRAA